MSNKRDYYEVLGIGREATKSEIKSAFHKLAMKLHPDKNKADDAEEKFREIGEAYEVLYDDEKRSIYDQYGHEGLRQGAGGSQGFSGFDFGGDFSDIFSSFFGGKSQRNRHANPDIKAQINISLNDSIFGTTITQKLHKFEECNTCSGKGSVNPDDIIRCNHCNGSGYIDQIARTPFGNFKQQSVCTTCNGQREVNKNPCNSCDGKKYNRVVKEVDIKIPEGIRDGEAIKVRGYGNLKNNNTSVGDLILFISVSKDKHYDVDGYNLIIHVPLSALSALSKAKILIPTPYGNKEIKIPSNLTSGDHVIIKNSGLPKGRWNNKGDLYVIFDLYIPKISKNNINNISKINDDTNDKTYDDFLKEFE